LEKYIDEDHEMKCDEEHRKNRHIGRRYNTFERLRVHQKEKQVNVS
jgi:hypothetical protein